MYELFGQGWSKQYGWVKKVIPMAKAVKVRSNLLDMDLEEGERSSMLMGHFPHGTSTRSLNHLG